MNADVITSGTLATERLIIRGDDGLIYEINAQALSDDAFATDYEEGDNMTATQYSIFPTTCQDNRCAVAASVLFGSG